MQYPWPNGWNHSIQYHDRILTAVPKSCGSALDVGCGGGLLTRRVALHCGAVVGIDLDPGVLAAASRHPASPANATFLHADVMTYPFPEAAFDLIASVAAIHHLPLEASLIRLKGLLAPGGVLAIIGLYRSVTLTDHAFAAAALPASRLLRLVRPWADVSAPIRKPRESFTEIRTVANALLPGVAFHRHLLFRFSLVWRKPPV